MFRGDRCFILNKKDGEQYIILTSDYRPANYYIAILSIDDRSGLRISTKMNYSRSRISSSRDSDLHFRNRSLHNLLNIREHRCQSRS